jgi:hypothetical protein
MDSTCEGGKGAKDAWPPMPPREEEGHTPYHPSQAVGLWSAFRPDVPFVPIWGGPGLSPNARRRPGSVAI